MIDGIGREIDVAEGPLPVRFFVCSVRLTTCSGPSDQDHYSAKYQGISALRYYPAVLQTAEFPDNQIGNRFRIWTLERGHRMSPSTGSCSNPKLSLQELKLA